MNAPRFTDSPEQAKVVNAPTGDDVLVVAGSENKLNAALLTAHAAMRTDAASRTVEVALKGKNSMGSHVTGSATLVMP